MCVVFLWEYGWGSVKALWGRNAGIFGPVFHLFLAAVYVSFSSSMARIALDTARWSREYRRTIHSHFLQHAQ